MMDVSAIDIKSGKDDLKRTSGTLDFCCSICGTKSRGASQNGRATNLTVHSNISDTWLWRMCFLHWPSFSISTWACFTIMNPFRNSEFFSSPPKINHLHETFLGASNKNTILGSWFVVRPTQNPTKMTLWGRRTTAEDASEACGATQSDGAAFRGPSSLWFQHYGTGYSPEN